MKDVNVCIPLEEYNSMTKELSELKKGKILLCLTTMYQKHSVTLAYVDKVGEVSDDVVNKIKEALHYLAPERELENFRKEVFRLAAKDGEVAKAIQENNDSIEKIPVCLRNFFGIKKIRC